MCASKPKGLRRGSSSEAVVIYLPLDSPVAMKSLFKSKPRTPSDIVRHTRDLVRLTNRDQDKLTLEFFKDNTLRLLIQCLPKFNLEARKDATQIGANLQRQQVQSKLIASDYLETNWDLMHVLISGYDNTDMALHYGAMLRECIRHQIVAKYVLDSPHMKKFFDYIQLPNFDIAADAAATFKELLTRHKSTVAEFLYKNYKWVDYFHHIYCMEPSQNSIPRGKWFCIKCDVGIQAIWQARKSYESNKGKVGQNDSKPNENIYKRLNKKQSREQEKVGGMDMLITTANTLNSKDDINEIQIDSKTMT
ncbi:hypothetical protein Fmac_032279 [Flemingia macrophylla]|uniref:Uncharacterized protein n=1 Tax=Flemingia macrophylla TaxID=520843 RepID=A0ABD1L4F5_9FABA